MRKEFHSCCFSLRNAAENSSPIAALSDAVLLVFAQRVEQVQRQLGAVWSRCGRPCTCRYRSARPGRPSCGCRQDRPRVITACMQIRICRAVRQPEFEAARAGHTHHVGAIIAGPGHRVGRPGRAGDRARGIDALVGVDRRIGDRSKSRGMLHDAAEEVPSLV